MATSTLTQLLNYDVRIETELFSYRGLAHLMFTCVLGRCVASTVLLVPNPSEGADRVGGQLRGDKECSFSGVTILAEFGGMCRKRCSECTPAHEMNR